MARYKMTAARRAALRKAQLASARKRRKGGSRRTRAKDRVRSARANSAVRKGRRARNKTAAQRRINRAHQSKAYAKKQYGGRGGYKRSVDDMVRAGGLQRTAAIVSFSPGAYGISAVRGRRTKSKVKRKGKFA